MSPKYVLPLNDSNATIETVGCKGMSLAKLARAGLPVLDGFHLTTEAYRQFVAVNNLQERILATLKNVDATNPTALEGAYATISRFFAQASIPTDISTAIASAYSELNNRQTMAVNAGNEMHDY